MNVQPLGKRLLLEPKADEKETASGLILAKDTKEKPMEGTVLVAGPDVEHVKPGYSVIFGKYSGTEISVENKNLIVLDEEDILAITGGV